MSFAWDFGWQVRAALLPQPSGGPKEEAAEETMFIIEGGGESWGGEGGREGERKGASLGKGGRGGGGEQPGYKFSWWERISRP